MGEFRALSLCNADDGFAEDRNDVFAVKLFGEGIHEWGEDAGFDFAAFEDAEGVKGVGREGRHGEEVKRRR
jgi:hypothetical protein